MTATSLLSETALRFVILGLATGALTALVSLGVVLVYRASGVLNFAAGALGAVGAFVCYSLRDDRGIPAPIAFLIGISVGALLGMLFHFGLSLLRGASLLTRLIATLGLFSAVQGFATIVYGTDFNQPASMLPTSTMSLGGGITVTLDRVIIIVTAVALAVGLRVMYAKTLFGLATSAVSENRRVTASAGWSPSAVELVNFTVAGALSSLAAILLAPIVTLSAPVLSLLVLPALAAALVGRFSSFGITVGVSFVIGIAGSELALFKPEIADLFGVDEASLSGLPQALPLLIIVVYVIAIGRGRLGRGETSARLPVPGSGYVSVAPLAIFLALAVFMLMRVSTTWVDALVATLCTSIIVLSVIVVSGYAGQLSLCQFALSGFGAWLTARGIIDFGLSFVPAALLGIAGTVTAGILVALPALRARGVNLAVTTLSLALLFHALVFTNGSLTGGYTGLITGPVELFGYDVNPLDHPNRYGLMALVVLLLCGLMVANVRRGRVGRRMLAVRSNERAAAALGIGVVMVKLYAFALAAAIAAVGGILLAFRLPNVRLAMFDVFGSASLVQFAVLGGLGWVSGVVLGAIAAPGALAGRGVSELFPETANVASWLALIAGVSTFWMLRTAPDGLAQVNARPFTRFFRWSTFPRRCELAVDDRRAHRSPAVLEVRDVTVTFGTVRAVSGASLTVRPGEVVGLIGPNGAGKTTMLDLITGFTSPDHGQVLLDGESIVRWSPEHRARVGLVRSWQAIELFEEMSVAENLLAASDRQGASRFLLDLLRPGRPGITKQVSEEIDALGLRPYLDQRPSSLPQGVSRLVGIARALACDPAVLLLDEPAAGLDHTETAEFSRVVRRVVRDRGIGVLIVEHDVPLLMATCDRLVVLDYGCVIAEGLPDDVTRDPLVTKAYLGADDEAGDEELALASAASSEWSS